VFSAVFGAVIARGQDYRETFQVFRPGFDLDKARQQRAEAANLSGSGKMTCISMSGPRWPSFVTTVWGRHRREPDGPCGRHLARP